MSYTTFGTITSQGQLTIPVKIRKLLGLDTPSGVVLRVSDDSLVIEPEKDLLSLGGSLKKNAIKNKSIDEIMKLEKQAMGKAIAKEYSSKFGPK